MGPDWDRTRNPWICNRTSYLLRYWAWYKLYFNFCFKPGTIPVVRVMKLQFLSCDLKGCDFKQYTKAKTTAKYSFA